MRVIHTSKRAMKMLGCALSIEKYCISQLINVYTYSYDRFNTAGPINGISRLNFNNLIIKATTGKKKVCKSKIQK
jgi:hypothetical protein